MTEDPTTITNLLDCCFDVLTSLEPKEAAEFLMRQRTAECERLAKFWRRFSLPHQCEPMLAQSGAP